MDLRNVVFAIALSFAVLFGWSVIFESPQIQEQSEKINKDNDQKLNDAPSVNLENPDIKKISREDSIKSSKRLEISP